MADTEPYKWGLAVVGAVAGLGLTAISLYELWLQRPKPMPPKEPDGGK